MDLQTILAGINAIVAVTSGLYNVAYFFTHANGKKWFRLLCGIPLIYIGLIYSTAFILGVSVGPIEMQPWVAIICLIPALDARIDWHRRTH